MAGQYRFIIGQIKNPFATLVPAPFIEVDAQNVEWTWGLNRAGTCSLAVDKGQIERAIQNSVPGYVPGTWAQVNGPGSFVPGGLTLWIQRDAVPIWGGIIWDISSASDTKVLNLTAEEFVSAYERMRFTGTFFRNSFGVNYNNSDQTVTTLLRALLKSEPFGVAMDLLSYGAGAAPNMNPVNVDYALQPAGAGTITDNTDAYRPLWYEWENRSMMDCIKNLMGVNLGFEFTQTIVWAHPQTGVIGLEPEGPHTMWQQSARFTMHSPRAGTDKVRPTLNYGMGAGSEVRKLNWTYDGRKYGNRLKVEGFRDANYTLTARRTTVEFISLQGPPLDGWGAPNLANAPLYVGGPNWASNLITQDITYSDTTLKNQAAVDAKANYLIQRLGLPTLTVRAEMNVGSNVNFSSLQLGDRIPVHIRDAGLDMQANLRVMGMGGRYEYTGQETLILDLVADADSYQDT